MAITDIERLELGEGGDGRAGLGPRAQPASEVLDRGPGADSDAQGDAHDRRPGEDRRSDQPAEDFVTVVGNNHPVDRKCQICLIPAYRTSSAILTPLAARTAPLEYSGKRRVYVKWICEDCVTLFNTRNWTKTRKALRELRGKGVRRR